jgi:SseB protein N-terminal domain
MNLLSKLFAGKKTQGAASLEEVSHQAVTQFIKGEISVPQMLPRLVAGFISVPLAEPPKMAQDNIESWKPATVSKHDGSQWLVAFTSTQAASSFSSLNNYPFGISTSTKWVLDVLPPAHGIVFNLGSQYLFEWSAEGISQYKLEVLGRSAS